MNDKFLFINDCNEIITTAYSQNYLLYNLRKINHVPAYSKLSNKIKLMDSHSARRAVINFTMKLLKNE